MVRMSAGRLGSSPSFCRRREMRTSMERSNASSLVPSDELEELLAGEHAPAPLGEGAEHLELAGGEGDLGAADGDAQRGRVEDQPADAQLLGARADVAGGARPARMDARQQLARGRTA